MPGISPDPICEGLSSFWVTVTAPKPPVRGWLGLPLKMAERAVFKPRIRRKYGAKGRSRTDKTLSGQRFLRPPRMPIPPP